MNTRTFKTVASALISVIAMTGCSSDKLDLYPETQDTANNYYTNKDQLQKGVNGAYSTLQLFGQYQIANLVLGELPSDNTWDEVPANDAGVCGQIDEFDMTSSNSIIEQSWSDNYIGIQQCNVVLNRIQGLNGLDDATRKQTEGEMKFLRALMYFNLVRIFGDVPLVTQETTNVNDYFGQGRTPSDQVYEQIITDLTEAADELPSTASQRGRATKYAALGILGKVYLTMKQYDLAAKCLNQIVASGKYQLLDDPARVFAVDNKGNKEIIFDVQFESGLNGSTEGSDAFRYFSPSGTVNGAKGHNIPTKEVYGLFGNQDKRRTAYFKETKGNVASNKFFQTSDIISDGGTNTVVLRYADVLLMLSECDAQQGLIAEANSLLNQIKRRAGVDEVNVSDKVSLLEEIALERRKELVCEGSRWFDLVRTGKAVETMNRYFKNTAGQTSISITEDDLVQPIPQSQIDTDSAIKQNKGYN